MKDNINNIYVVQGFIASSPKGEPLLLGRGGSDTTGAIIANMVNAKYYEVWTDVEGIYTADPRLVGDVKHIKNISYDLIQELAAMGAKVMHPLSIIPCQLKSIPIYVKSTFNINGNHTKIHTDDFNDTCIAIQKNVSVFHMKSMDMWNSYGFVNDIFRRFSQNQVDVNIITTSQFSISTTTNETNSYILKDLEQELNKDYDTKLVQNCVILSIISNNVRKIMSKISFEEFTSEIIHIGSNNLSINIVLKEKTNDELREIINKMFI
jgi:aspartate kinase